MGSVRYFYPDIPIRLLIGGPLQRGLAEELRRYWNVEIADLPRGDYGWGFVKLEPLFGRSGERFLVLDSDTVLTGAVLDIWERTQAPFLVDDEPQTDARAKEIYYDWDRLREIDPTARRPNFLFNSGQWFGTAGILARDDFDKWVEWTMPRLLRHPEFFMPGDQGVHNCVLNQKVESGELQVARYPIMRWPGNLMDGLVAEKVANRSAPPLIVHWAGMKKIRLAGMVGSDLLRFFEGFYYAHTPGGSVRRAFAACRHCIINKVHGTVLPLKLAYRNRRGKRSMKRNSSSEVTSSVVT